LIRINRWVYAVCGAAVALALAVWGIQAAVRAPFGAANQAHGAPLPPGTVPPAPSASAGDYPGDTAPADPNATDPSTTTPNAVTPNTTTPPNPGVNPAPPMPTGQNKPTSVAVPPPAAPPAGAVDNRDPIHW
jgi:hypothetical protein